MRFRQWLEDDRLHSQALADTGFWGRAGAGAVIMARDTGRILLPHRSRSVEQPGTWGVWGGAIDPGEDPELAARREVEEEAGATQAQEMIPLHVFRKGEFRYHNFLAIVPAEFAPRLNWETQGYKWVDYGDWPRPLHFGLESLIRNSGDEIRRRTVPQVQEMALKSYRTDFHHEPEDDEGFYRKADGTRDLGHQVYRPKGSTNAQYDVSGYFSGKDRTVITHPRTFRTLEQRLARSGYDFNILLIEDPGAASGTDYDEQVELFMRENGIEERGHITFVKNGTSGHVMTPWMILHTIGHAVVEHAGGDRSGRAVGAKSIMLDRVTDITSLASDSDCRWRPTPKCQDAIGKVFAFKSADPRNPHSIETNRDELVHELVAEFLWNGDRIRVKPPHDADGDIARLVGDIEGKVRDLLDNCVGKVVYDYYDG